MSAYNRPYVARALHAANPKQPQTTLPNITLVSVVTQTHLHTHMCDTSFLSLWFIRQSHVLFTYFIVFSYKNVLFQFYPHCWKNSWCNSTIKYIYLDTYVFCQPSCDSPLTLRYHMCTKFHTHTHVYICGCRSDTFVRPQSAFLAPTASGCFLMQLSMTF